MNKNLSVSSVNGLYSLCEIKAAHFCVRETCKLCSILVTKGHKKYDNDSLGL